MSIRKRKGESDRVRSGSGERRGAARTFISLHRTRNCESIFWGGHQEREGGTAQALTCITTREDFFRGRKEEIEVAERVWIIFWWSGKVDILAHDGGQFLCIGGEGVLDLSTNTMSSNLRHS